ncbi:MAG: hypothetical protein ACN6N0_16265 [Microvirgula sp.]
MPAIPEIPAQNILNTPGPPAGRIEDMWLTMDRFSAGRTSAYLLLVFNILTVRLDTEN